MNSARGNEYYDWSDTNAPGYAFPAHPEAPLCSSDFDSWDPPGSVKGDIARAVFYMAVRYEGDVVNEPNLELVDDISQISSTNVLVGKLAPLLQWHQLDPVDAAEQTRNQGVFSYQGNRNPFVDRPEWVEEVFVPRLAIEPKPDGIRVRWAVTGAAPVLESADGWSPWDTVTNTPALDGQEWFVDLAASDAVRFYRLRL